MNIFAQLSFHHDVHLQRELATMNTIEALRKSRLSFQCANFRGGKMLVEVLLDTAPLDAPRHEIEAEELIQRELDKAGLSASVLIVHGTQYIDETLPRV